MKWLRNRHRRSTKTGRGIDNSIGSLDGEHHMYWPVGEYVPGGSFNGLQTYSWCSPNTAALQRYHANYRGVNEVL